VSAPVYVLAGQSNATIMRAPFASVIAERTAGVAINHTRGGTTLAAIEPDPDAELQVGILGLDWSPDSDGELFDGLLAKLPAGATVAGVLWVQGEGDAQDEAMANAYADNLSDFIAALRAAWGPVPVVIAELASEALHPFAGIVRAAQYAEGEIVIDADDLLFKPDGRHYSDHAATTMAHRFLDALEGRGHEAPTDTMAYGTAGAETLWGSAGSDLLDGRAGNDALYGLDGGDTLKGREGNDRLDGGDGDDWIMGGLGRDAIRGGAGVDTVSYGDMAQGVVVDLELQCGGGDRIVLVENVQGSAFADTIRGDGARNALWGGAGDDTLFGGAGADRLYGGAGADTFLFSAGRDKVFDFELGTDRIGAAFADVTIEDLGGSALLTLGSDTMLLQGIAPGDLDAADFLA
jgi:Ca2+-binding RTX toxin-like protein